MNQILIDLDRILEYRSIRRQEDSQFVATVVRLVHPDRDPNVLAAQYDVSISEIRDADEFLQDPSGMIEDQRGIIEWDAIRRAEELREKSQPESMIAWITQEFDKRYFAFSSPVTARQAGQMETAASGDWEFVMDALDIVEQKILHAQSVRSRVGLILTILKQPREKVRQEANEWREKAIPRPKANREPITPD